MHCPASEDVKGVASAFILEFNRRSPTNIVEWKVREPEEAEIAAGIKFGGLKKVDKTPDGWLIEKDGVVKQLFVLEPTKIEEVPPHIFELRQKALREGDSNEK